MCGIFGWIGAEPEFARDAVACMSRVLAHRGPDDEGFEMGRGWGLGFRRLSILDLSPQGHQPMSYADARYWIIFNGEIYNYVELRRKLERAGETFSSSSDTEVLLRMLARYGPQALGQLNGMFALAFVDTERRTFLLARDRLGVKPLYCLEQNGLRFASELKALLAWHDAPRELNRDAALDFLALGYLPNETCILNKYFKLPPGHYLAGEMDAPAQARLVPYWNLQINPEFEGSPLGAPQLEELENLLADAVSIRLRSDVPVGIFLSGGMDSGLVAVLAARAKQGTRPLALTVGFDNAEYDESEFARAVTTRAELEHRIIKQQPATLADLDRLAWFFDEPFGDPSALPTLALCQAARKHAVVFLSGDGGDEAFGGYRRYIETLRLKWLTHLPKFVGAGAQKIAGMLDPRSARAFQLCKSSLPDSGFAASFDIMIQDPALRTILSPEMQSRLPRAAAALWERWASSRGACLTARQQALDYALYLPDDILVKMDRASMAHSIEVRSPFLDYRLVEWAARLPRATLLNQHQGKLPLRAIGARSLPPEVLRGAKRGFGVPLQDWFRKPAGQNLVQERLVGAHARPRDLWDPRGIETLLATHQLPTARDFGFHFWRVLAFDAWARQYLESPRKFEPLAAVSFVE